MAAKLIGIESGRGTCDRCETGLTARRFRVMQDGQILILGRRCAAKATGYNPNAIDREAKRVERLAVTANRRATVAAEFPGLDSEMVGEIAVADYLWRDDAGWRQSAESVARCAA